MYTFCVIMIIIASILLILAVLVQSPKSGMAANFGAANQTMGVRQTTDFLEKFTWAMVAAIVFFTLLSVIALPKSESAENLAGIDEITEALTPAETTEVVEATEDVVVEADAEAVEAEGTTETEETVEATTEE
ncbi:MAG: preprotein translocase subunit SecG [Alistipes sp.]|nr:preprotein translocase subunit SecG [Alistipes sp.]